MANPQRSTAGISTAAKGTTLWNFLAPDPTKVHTYFNDFDTYAAGDFTITETGSGTRALTAVEGGNLLITNAAADNDNNQFQLVTAGFTLVAGKRAWFKCRCKISDATQSDWCVGMTSQDTDVFSSADGDGVTDGVFFWKDDGDTNIDIQVQLNATTGQTRSTAVATMDTNFHVYGWDYDGAAYIKFYVDDVHISTMDASATYLPDAALVPTFAIKNGEAVAKTMTVDYIFASVER